MSEGPGEGEPPVSVAAIDGGPSERILDGIAVATGAAATWQLVTAFALVYLIWGSTYLGIRVAIETIPPFTMLALRYLIAGSILYAIIRARGAPAPKAADWSKATVIGALLLLAGNGAAAWAIRTVPSGITAVVIAMSPLWMVLIDWLRPGGTRPTLAVALGIVGGLAGIALLLDPTASRGVLTPEGAIVLLVGTISWAGGSIYSRTSPMRVDPFLGTAMQMLCGAVLLGIAGAAIGEWPQVRLEEITLRSILALGYLAVFGSLVAFTAYIWLLHHTTTAKASTYAYVNPVVALILGWAIGGEELAGRTVAAAAIIIGSVVVIGRFAQFKRKNEK
jgi:drug/metabolite transporter (DMT)-like permease